MEVVCFDALELPSFCLYRLAFGTVYMYMFARVLLVNMIV